MINVSLTTLLQKRKRQKKIKSDGLQALQHLFQIVSYPGTFKVVGKSKLVAQFLLGLNIGPGPRLDFDLGILEELNDEYLRKECITLIGALSVDALPDLHSFVPAGFFEGLVKTYGFNSPIPRL